MQGISTKIGPLRENCPTDRSKISWLQDNSLEIGTWNVIVQDREFIETSREFAVSCRELPAGCGNSVPPKIIGILGGNTIKSTSLFSKG
jgi:hypothetical protein